MTQKIIYIVLLIAGFILLSSRSCVPDTDMDQEEGLKAQQDAIRVKMQEDFGSPYLFEDQLMVYGEKARQKLLDFADYLSLYSGKNLDTLFKLQVRDMLYTLFCEPDPLVRLSLIPGETSGKRYLSNLIGSINASDYQSIIFTVSDLKTHEFFQWESNERYTGSLYCHFGITGVADHDTILLYNQCNRVKTVLVQTSKNFGEDQSMLVWQVFLTEIDACPD
jgi:hypothetical protein